MTAQERATAGYFRASRIVDEGWATTLEAARLLAATAILLQCPASFTPSDEHVGNLRAFLDRARRPAGVRLLWEPRGAWPDALIASLCAELERLAAMIPPGGDTYAMFNNVPRPTDSVRFLALVSGTAAATRRSTR